MIGRKECARENHKEFIRKLMTIRSAWSDSYPFVQRTCPTFPSRFVNTWDNIVSFRYINLFSTGIENKNGISRRKRDLVP